MEGSTIVSTSRPDDVFRFVFPPVDFTTPTPEATPNIGVVSSPGQSFGGFNLASDPAAATVRLNKSWSVATRHLSLSVDKPPPSKASSDVVDAVLYLLDLPSARKDLLAWHANETSTHFAAFVLPELHAWNGPIPVSEASSVLDRTVRTLQDTYNFYLTSIQSLRSSVRTGSKRNAIEAFGQQVRSGVARLVTNSLPRQRLQKTLATVLYRQMTASLQDRSLCPKDGDCRCQTSLGNLSVVDLEAVGLGGRTGERAFSYAIHQLLKGPAIQRPCFHVDWTGQSSIVPKLQRWIQSSFTPFVESTLALLTANPHLKLTKSDSHQFTSTAIANLGRERTSTLFEYVNRWPESQGAVLDIKEYLALGTPEDKARVCAAFSTQLSERLLHSGASSPEILSIYINVIHSFRLLDSRGVLLEKVGSAIRNYLRARDDTVQIIAESLLADSDAQGNIKDADRNKVCMDIPSEVARSALEGRQDDGLLNWNDMEWMPDPIDAGPDYKASNSEDVVAYILGLFEQEDFINEVRNVLARHLLETRDSEYSKETRLIELLKARLDATKLQAVEVMLKDIRDSVHINKRINPVANHSSHAIPTPQEVKAAIPEDGITLQALHQRFEGRIKQAQFLAILNLVAMKRQDLLYPRRTRARFDQPQPVNNHIANVPEFRVQIISKNFWPDLSTDSFTLPPKLASAQDTFEQRFVQQGSQRKLHFRPALGKVNVELQLEDRTYKEEDVQAWKASVINAFSDESLIAAGASLTVEEVAAALSMDEELATSGLHYWVSKRVLYQPSPANFAVLERLDMDVDMDHATVNMEEDVSSAKTQQALLQASAPMFSTFILSMLQNTGPKEIGGMMGITNMLKMVNPTFTYGDDEVRWLLGEMERRGEITRDGDLWKIKR